MTEAYLVVLEVRYRGGEITAAAIEELTDALLDVVAQDSTISEPDVAASLGVGAMDVQMVVTASDQAQASVKALATVRTAIGDATAASAGWEETHELLRVAPLDAADRMVASA